MKKFPWVIFLLFLRFSYAQESLKTSKTTMQTDELMETQGIPEGIKSQEAAADMVIIVAAVHLLSVVFPVTYQIRTLDNQHGI